MEKKKKRKKPSLIQPPSYWSQGEFKRQKGNELNEV